MKVKFVLERKTKGALRYQEQLESGRPKVIGVLYLRKAAFPKEPDVVEVEIKEPAE